MFRRKYPFRLLITVLALAALSAVMAAACGGAEDEEAKDVAPAATQAPVVQAATAAPGMAATAAPAMAPTAAPVAQVATAAPAMAATAEMMGEDVVMVTGVPVSVQKILDELGLVLWMQPAATTEPQHGGTLRVTGLEPKLWDIHQYTSYKLRMTDSYTHQRLLRYEAGPGSSPNAYISIPSTAESWDIEDGGKRFVFHLRKGVKWHKDPPGVDSVPASLAGRDLVASDWVFSYERAKTHEQAARAREYLQFTEVMTAPDDYTLVLQNSQIVAAFITWMSGTALEALAPEMEPLCGDYAIPSCSHVGNGAWMFAGHNPGVSSSFIRNPDYWEKPLPYIDELVQLYFGDDRAEDAAFRTGQVDLIGIDTCAISGIRYEAMSKTNPELLFPSFSDSLNKRGIWMRADKAPFNDLNVRRAVALAIDRIGWVKGPLGGYGLPFGGNLAYGTEFWLPDDGYGDASQWLKYDPERAVALLAESGYGPGDLQVTMESTPGFGERFAAEAEVSTEFLNEIGIKTTLNMRDYDSFYPVWWFGEYDNLAYSWSQSGFTLRTGCTSSSIRGPRGRPTSVSVTPSWTSCSTN